MSMQEDSCTAPPHGEPGGGDKNEKLARPGQSLRDHLLGGARRAEAFASAFNAAPWGRACGLLHDMGKASEKFQRRVACRRARMDRGSTKSPPTTKNPLRLPS